MARLDLKNVSKIFVGPKREEVAAVTDLTLTVQDGELIVLVGPSGCGKTTILRMIAGLETPSGGTISIDGIDMAEVEPQDRDVAMVFQRDALYPHLTVFENLAFGLKVRRQPPDEIERRVKEAAATLGLARLLDRAPSALSGGQRQRVALGRALVRKPKLFLFDEPLSNLDPASRLEMRSEIAKLHRRLGATIIHVTHDQAEAMTLGQRIVVMNEGAVQQIADPVTLYRAPANLFVAGFIGSPGMNFFRGRVLARDDGFVFQENNHAGAANGFRFEVPILNERGARLAAFAEGNVILGLRPEHIVCRPGGSSSDSSVAKAGIQAVEPLGRETWLHASTGGHTFIAREEGVSALSPGEVATFALDMARACFFNPAAGTMIV